jgi:N-acetylglucosamine-6-sulfatase
VEYASGARELYDLVRDPYELNNLAGTKPAIQAALSKRLDALKGCSGNGCSAAEGP